MDKLDFLDGQEPAPAAAPEPQVEQAAQPAPEAATGGPERGPDGKFVSKAPEASPATELAPAATPAPAEPPTKTAPPEGYVPVQEVQRLRRELQEIRQAQQAPPPSPPDRYEDPEGYESFQEQQRQASIINVRLDISEEMARTKHGDDAVTAAQQWALEQYESVPGFQQRVVTHRNPYEFVVQEHQRHQLMSELTADDLAKFKAWKAGSASPVAMAAPVVASPTQPPTPPRSLAAAANAGGAKPGAIPAGPGEAFNAVFKD